MICCFIFMGYSNIYAKSTSVRYECDIWHVNSILIFLKQTDNWENIKDPHYWPFVRGIHWLPVDSLHKGSVMLKAFPYQGIIMKTENNEIFSSVKWLPSLRFTDLIEVIGDGSDVDTGTWADVVSLALLHLGFLLVLGGALLLVLLLWSYKC